MNGSDTDLSNSVFCFIYLTKFHNTFAKFCGTPIGSLVYTVVVVVVQATMDRSHIDINGHSFLLNRTIQHGGNA